MFHAILELLNVVINGNLIPKLRFNFSLFYWEYLENFQSSSCVIRYNECIKSCIPITIILLSRTIDRITPQHREIAGNLCKILASGVHPEDGGTEALRALNIFSPCFYPEKKNCYYRNCLLTISDTVYCPRAYTNICMHECICLLQKVINCALLFLFVQFLASVIGFLLLFRFISVPYYIILVLNTYCIRTICGSEILQMGVHAKIPFDKTPKYFSISHTKSNGLYALARI
jgi:hypothetical protein